MREGDAIVGELPVHLLTDDAPVYERPRAPLPPPPTLDEVPCRCLPTWAPRC